METHVVYCSARDREVRVVFEKPPGDTNSPSGIDPTGVCIDYCSKACTGSLCSLFDEPPAAMLDRLRNSGLEGTC